MNRIVYEMRGWAYWAECANPFSRTVTARSLPLGLRIQGYKRDAVGRGLYRRGVHEPALTKFLIERFSNKPGSNFLDLGGNIGYFTCLLGKLAGPTGKVVSVEPEPNNRELLLSNVKRNGLSNVTVHACAVGDKDGTAKMGLYKAANRGRHSLVDLESCKEFIEVPVRRVDDLVKDAGVQSWALVKMDVEGYEPFVFEGAPQTLARTELLALEYAPSYWKKAGVDPEAVFRKLAGNFSRVYHIQHQELNLLPISPEECVRSDMTLDLLFER